MDTARAALGLALAATFLACEGRLLTITVEDEAQTTIPRGTLVEQLVSDLGFEELSGLDVTAAEELQNQGVAPGDISEVYLTRFELEAVEPAGADLAFIERLDVFVEAPDLPRVQIASGSAFPDGEAVVELVVGEVDLAPYVVSRSMTITTDATGSRPDEDVTVTARFALEVGVTTQGACHALEER